LAKTLFIEKDKQMITVPACAECEAIKRRGEVTLRDFVNLDILGGRHPDATAHIEKMVQSGPAKRAFLRTLIDAAEEVPLTSEEGIQLDTGLRAEFNLRPAFETLKYVTRGLYFHERGEMLPPDCPLVVLDVPWNNRPKVWQQLGQRSPGPPTVKGNFAVWYQVFPFDGSTAHDSLWALTFNNGVLFLAGTGDAAVALQRAIDQINERVERKESQERQLRAMVKVPPKGIVLPKTSDGKYFIP
jgi:hypothetical protein